jgi:hypothetical protein
MNTNNTNNTPTKFVVVSSGPNGTSTSAPLQLEAAQQELHLREESSAQGWHQMMDVQTAAELFLVDPLTVN